MKMDITVNHRSKSYILTIGRRHQMKKLLKNWNFLTKPSQKYRLPFPINKFNPKGKLYSSLSSSLPSAASTSPSSQYLDPYSTTFHGIPLSYRSFKACIGFQHWKSKVKFEKLMIIQKNIWVRMLLVRLTSLVLLAQRWFINLEYFLNRLWLRLRSVFVITLWGLAACPYASTPGSLRESARLRKKWMKSSNLRTFSQS
jgi:hypothetical protein